MSNAVPPLPSSRPDRPLARSLNDPKLVKRSSFNVLSSSLNGSNMNNSNGNFNQNNNNNSTTNNGSPLRSPSSPSVNNSNRPVPPARASTMILRTSADNLVTSNNNNNGNNNNQNSTEYGSATGPTPSLQKPKPPPPPLRKSATGITPSDINSVKTPSESSNSNPQSERTTSPTKNGEDNQNTLNLSPRRVQLVPPPEGGGGAQRTLSPLSHVPPNNINPKSSNEVRNERSSTPPYISRSISKPPGQRPASSTLPKGWIQNKPPSDENLRSPSDTTPPPPPSRDGLPPKPEFGPKPNLPPKPQIPLKIQSEPPKIPPKPVIELGTEDIDKLFESLRKFCNSAKQLIAVSKSICFKAEKLQKGKTEILRSQLLVAISDLEGTFTVYAEEVKTITPTKRSNEVIKLYSDLNFVINLTSVLMNGMKQLTKEADDEDMFKQTLKSMTTARDSVNLLTENVTKYSYHVDSAGTLLAILKRVADSTSKSLSFLIGSKTGRLISFSRKLEFEAASRAVITSIYTLAHSFNGTIASHILAEAKVASSTISQLVATINETVNSNSNLLSLPDVKQSLTNYAVKLKNLFAEFITQTKEQISKHSKQSYDILLEAMEPIRTCIKDLIIEILCYAEIDTAGSSGSIKLDPSPENIDRATKIVSLPENIQPSSNSQQSPGGLDYPDDLVPDTDDIWDEPEGTEGRILLGENDTLKCATLNILISTLTSSTTQDMNFTKTFMTTFRSFTTPEILLKKLIQRYHVPETSPESPLPIQLRVCNALKLWVDSQYKDFTGDLLVQLQEFLNELEESKTYSKFATSIRATLYKLKEDEENTQNEIVNLVIESKIPLLPSTMLFVFDEEELARQLTLVDFRIYQSIKPEELLNQAWSKPKLKHRASNVLALVARSTALTKWVASVILWQETLKGRIRALTKMINIAEHLRKLNNFNSVMAVIAGINTSAIFRLKFTRNGITSQSQELFASLQEMMDPMQSYANYRQRLRQSDPPLIPFLGTYLTDITFIEDGNPDYIKGLINFRKREFNYNVLREIQQFQLIGYNFNFVDNIAHCLTDLPVIYNDDDLYNLSLIREPKNATIESLP